MRREASCQIEMTWLRCLRSTRCTQGPITHGRALPSDLRNRSPPLLGKRRLARIPEERHIYYDGKQHARKVKIALRENERNEVVDALRRDVQFLIAQGVMDYSLLVAVKRKVSSFPLNVKLFRVVRPDGTEMYMALAIIDFLQKWTMGKRVAQVIKCMECDKATIPPQPYGERFIEEFSQRFSIAQAGSIGNGDKDDGSCTLA
mmetsp:Transcript_27679/g.63985  ORF Transcript_27679/g.63985 Transcript_27679/m.63985 type:complete len:203 (-) Transcript_27679:67-675(-)